jgi:hypothetical protein
LLDGVFVFQRFFFSGGNHIMDIIFLQLVNQNLRQGLFSTKRIMEGKKEEFPMNPFARCQHSLTLVRALFHVADFSVYLMCSHAGKRCSYLSGLLFQAYCLIYFLCFNRKPETGK